MGVYVLRVEEKRSNARFVEHFALAEYFISLSQRLIKIIKEHEFKILFIICHIMRRCYGCHFITY